MKTKKFELNKSFLSRGWLIAILLVMFFSTACKSLPIEIELPWLNTPAPTEETELPANLSDTPTPALSDPELALTAVTGTEKLIVWLPPELSPHEESLAGHLLQEKLNSFAQQNKVEIVVRVKAQTGSGSLTDALTAANAAAPTILPDLIVLSATDLQLAAKRDLVYPHPRLQELMNDTDWFPFGQELSMVNGEVLGSLYSPILSPWFTMRLHCLCLPMIGLQSKTISDTLALLRMIPRRNIYCFSTRRLAEK